MRNHFDDDDDDITRELEQEIHGRYDDNNSGYPQTPKQDSYNVKLASNNAQVLRVYLKKYAFIIKLICALDFIVGVVRCFTPNALWLGAAVVFAPIGFAGALKFRRHYVLAYLLYSCIEVILIFLYTFLYVQTKTQMILFMLSAVGECIVCFYVARFFKHMPVDGVIRA